MQQILKNQKIWYHSSRWTLRRHWTHETVSNLKKNQETVAELNAAEKDALQYSCSKYKFPTSELQKMRYPPKNTVIKSISLLDSRH